MAARKISLGLCAMAIAALLMTTLLWIEARPAAAGAVAPPVIASTSIGGVVTSAKGPEAGVWVIAETNDLPKKFAKIVVTDDQGRYVVPGLPKGNYKVWVRGYGLVDSKPVPGVPGKIVNLTASVAPSARAAAQFYPADYWFSLFQIPPKSAFPMEKAGIKTQEQFIDMLKGSILLIQIGDKATRELPETLGKFNSSQEAWEKLLKSDDSPVFGAYGMPVEETARMYADWTDRIAAGEIPPAPPRPQGVERNVVISEWDWSNEKGFIHDEITTDKRHPTVNPNGLVYGLQQHSADVVEILDPITHLNTQMTVPVRDESMPPAAFGLAKTAPLTYGSTVIRPGIASLHNPMMDQKGRLWITAQFRMGEKGQPDFCTDGAKNPSAKFFPLQKNTANGDPNGREVEVYDPATKKFTMVDTCFGTHHLEFAEDANNTLWFSGGNQVVGWLNTKLYDETGDASKAQGWCPYILDTNGNGKIDEYVGPNDPVDPKKDKRIQGGGITYGIGTSPVDNSIWMANFGYPGAILHVIPGNNPPYSCMTEIYNVPKGTWRPKGIDVDGNGVAWIGFATSGNFASFDRRKCKVLNGPSAIGDQCPEGWAVYQTPGPAFKGAEEVNSDYHYLDWVDRFDTLGLGKNVPMAPGTNSDSIIALLPDTKKFVVMRVPYPLGFYSRGMDGRIDDPNAGWKGKGLWSTYASISPWHYEGGKGATSKVVKLQVRPNPLAD